MEFLEKRGHGAYFFAVPAACCKAELVVIRIDSYVNIYFERLPENHSPDEIVDSLSDLLEDQGEVTGTGAGSSGGNVDIDVFGEINDMLKDIKAFLFSNGFGADTILRYKWKKRASMMIPVYFADKTRHWKGVSRFGRTKWKVS